MVGAFLTPAPGAGGHATASHRPEWFDPATAVAMHREGQASGFGDRNRQELAKLL